MVLSCCFYCSPVLEVSPAVVAAFHFATLLLVSSSGLSWASLHWAPQFWLGWCHPQLLLSPWKYHKSCQFSTTVNSHFHCFPFSTMFHSHSLELCECDQYPDVILYHLTSLPGPGKRIYCFQKERMFLSHWGESTEGIESVHHYFLLFWDWWAFCM